MSQQGRKKIRRRLRAGAYLLPSLFTVGNILLGFYAVIRGLRGDFHLGALLIILAGVLDNLDGRIARLTHTESDFGREFDSLADNLTFGIAPALLCYLWGLQEAGRTGWLVPLFFLVCAASRLARFNVQARPVDSRYFVGLPVPAAAGSVASILFFAPDVKWHPWLIWLVMGALVWLGLLMVSTFRYTSFKQVDLRKRWSYRTALGIAAVLFVVISDPAAFFLAAAVIYSSSGPVAWVYTRLVRSRSPDEKTLDIKKAGP